MEAQCQRHRDSDEEADRLAEEHGDRQGQRSPVQRPQRNARGDERKQQECHLCRVPDPALELVQGVAGTWRRIDKKAGVPGRSVARSLDMMFQPDD